VHDLKHALGDACENSAAPLVLLTTSRSEFAMQSANDARAIALSYRRCVQSNAL